MVKILHGRKTGQDAEPASRIAARRRLFFFIPLKTAGDAFGFQRRELQTGGRHCDADRV